MNSEQTLQASLKNSRALFIDTLRSLSLLDIGTIVSIQDGRALVHGCSFAGGKQLVYQDAEVIYPGNDQGVYGAVCAGTPCLIFIPASCMPSISDRKVRFTASPYNKAGVKVMPIGNGTNNPVKVQFNNDGTYSISTKEYTVSFQEECLGYYRPDGASSIEIDTDGNIYLNRKDTSTCLISVEKDKVTVSCNQNNVQWDISIQNGQLLLQQKDSNDTELASITIDASGNASINAKEIKLNGDSKKFVTYSELDNALQGLLNSLKTHTHPVSTEGTAAAQTGTAAASLDLSSVTLDISGSATSTVKTGG